MLIKSVLFDLDGTLIDHLRAIHRCFAHTLPKLGYPAPSKAQVLKCLGGGLEDALLRFLPKEKIEEAVAIYVPYWDSTMLDGAELMPGARELLVELNERGVCCAVISNKHGPSSRRLCNHLGIAPFLKGTFGATDTPWTKPHPDFVAHVLKEIGASPESTIIVGDSPFDVQSAHNAHLAGAWCVSTGTHSAEELRKESADAIFENMAALHTALLPSLPPRP